VDRRETAFGAWRRIPRDASEPVVVTPPGVLDPPFEARRVAPESFETVEVAPHRFNLSVELGLEEPRAREPPASDARSITADVETLAVAPAATASTTLSWGATGEDTGEWVARVASTSDSDTAPVTISDSEWVFAFGVETLTVTSDAVTPVEFGAGGGRGRVGLELLLAPAQVATVMAAGSRVDAAQIRQPPDAQAVGVDTLPSSDLTCQVSVPEESSIESGEYVLTSWSAEHRGTHRLPYSVSLEFHRRP
jgi:hypothetical protein